MASSSSSSSSKLPLHKIPGDYGLPFFGPIKDRLEYFYCQGQDKFFQNKSRKYQSTVFRTNMPPGPFIASNPKVICLLDAVSFPVLFDTSKVEKRNVFVGTYFPSVSFTGGYRVCSYLDPAEPKHNSIKSFIFFVLASKHDKFIPVFRTCLSDLFTKLEDEVATKKEADFNSLNDTMSFNYAFQLFCDKNPADTTLGSTSGASLAAKWLLLQLAPIGTLGILPKILDPLEDLLFHTFSLPPCLVKSDYKKLYNAFKEHAGPLLDEAENKFGIGREEALHNLVFFTCFNTFGGLKTLFPAIIKWVGLAGEELHKQLAQEIRTIVSAEGGVTITSLEKMVLTKSVVYEVLRIEPSVPFQYGKAKVDMVVESHDAAFEIKKGEMIFGYQPFATKDPRVFENAEEFVGNRFVGEGEKLLKYVYWSNGRETEEPSADNKQCPGKNLVVLLSRVLLVEFFLRYDTFKVEAGKFFLGSTATIKSLVKPTTTSTT